MLGPGSFLYDGEGIQCWGQDPPCMMGGSSAGARVLSVWWGIQCWGQGPPCMRVGRGTSAEVRSLGLGIVGDGGSSAGARVTGVPV